MRQNTKRFLRLQAFLDKAAKLFSARLFRMRAVFLAFSCIFFFVPYMAYCLDYEPYREDEFPLWARKLRRAEVITFGATAITYPIIGLFTDFNDDVMEEFWIKFGVSAAAGAVIALADYIIGEVNGDYSQNEPEDAIVRLDPSSRQAIRLDEARERDSDESFSRDFASRMIFLEANESGM